MVYFGWKTNTCGVAVNSGIYVIHHRDTPEILYVGQTVNFVRRRSEHMTGRRSSKYIREEIRVHGRRAFVFRVVAEIPATDPQHLLRMEKVYADYYRASGYRLYNLEYPGKMPGCMAEETRVKLSNALRGRPGPTAGLKMGPMTPEHKAAISAGQLRRAPRTLEERARTSAKISANKTGKLLGPRSAEANRKTAAGLRGIVRSAETKAKCRASAAERSHPVCAIWPCGRELTYSSIHAAAQAVGVSKQAVMHALSHSGITKGVRVTVGGKQTLAG